MAVDRDLTAAARARPLGEIAAALREALPDIALSTDSLERYQTDIFYRADHPPLAVARPKAAMQVQALVRAAGTFGLSLVTRGAGLSYSGGTIPADARTIVVDMRGMDRITEINERDRFVTAEAGASWAQLRDALAGTGLTTPFRGPFSGRHATIGAALSQGAKLYGSGNGGTSAETTLGVSVVTGTGDLVTTGSAGGIHRPSPFFRPYGPDLTGLFLGDCGALGIKVAASLQLVPAAAATQTGGFSFDDPLGLMNAMAEIGGQMLASECFGLDPMSVRARMGRTSLGDDLSALKSVAQSGGSALRGLRDAAAVVARGRRFADDVGYLLNCVSEGADADEARRRMRQIGAIAARHGGRETASSMARVMRADPFPAITGLLSGSSRRIHWMHTVLPNTRGAEGFGATEAVFDSHRATMDRLKITRGYLLSANGPSCVGVETLVHWPDAPYALHRYYLEEVAGRTVTARPENPEARAAVKAICDDLVEAWARLGGAHLQIGRKYPYYETRQAPVRTMLDGLKAMLDPHGLINPGSVLPTHKEAL